MISERLMEIDRVSKEYRLGMIGGGTLRADLQSLYARLRGREDPNRKIGAVSMKQNEYFMALSDVSLRVDRGDALGVVGRNGAGKSTLLKLISRITAPTEGEIRIRGRVASLLEIGTGFHPELTGLENIYLNGAILGMGRTETASKLEEIIEFSEISQFIGTPVKRYSSGMYVKLAFAVAAHLDPDVLICDEVLAVGDMAFQHKCIAKMREIAATNCAVLYVSHSMRTISELCNRAVFLESGKLLYDGDVGPALDMYAGSGQRDTLIDLDRCPRRRNHGAAVRMLKLEFTGAELVDFALDGCMEFVLSLRCEVPVAGMGVQLVVKAANQSPLGMTQSQPIDVAAGEIAKLRFRLPLRGIAPGEYSVRLLLTEPGARGKLVTLDMVEDAAGFRIADDAVENGGVKWSESNWGSYRLEPLEWLGF